MSNKTAIETNMDDIFQEVYQESLQNGGEVLMSYFGKFSSDLVSSFADEIEHIMKSKEPSKLITKRMFSVMIEALQNICIHGKGVTQGKIFGHVLLIEKEEGYTVSFGNLVTPNKMEVLNDHLERVNGMTSTQLKEHYLRTLSKGMPTEESGAGLGIITIALKFNSKMMYQFKRFDDDLHYYNLNINTQ